MDDSAPHHHIPSSPTGGPAPGDPPHRLDQVAGPHQRPGPGGRMGPGRRLSLVVLALSLLATALLCLLLARGAVGLVNGGLLLIGLPVAILGAGIIVSGLRRRRGGWMSLLGWPALLVALPVLALGAVVPTAVRAIPPRGMEQAVGRTTYTWQDLVEAGSGTSRELPVVAAGEVVLDLREMPQEARGAEAGDLALSAIDVELGAGEVRILAGEDAPITVEAESSRARFSARVPQAWSIDEAVSHGAGDRGGWDMWDTDVPDVWDEDEYTPDGSPARMTTRSEGALDSAVLRSPAAQSSGTGLTVRARLGAGRIIVNGPQEVTWEGDASQEVWVVEYWRDETGRIHLDDHDLVVPGMTHPAIGARRAQQCVEQARGAASSPADDDAPWDSDEDRDHYDRDWEAWEGLDELTAEQRRAYSDCARQAATDQGQAATASPAPSPAPSASATD
ncbi:hypothetical protein [Actinomyces bowdenii]|uniref:Uncharacterized protein n=1 Tax=Actinomyces bowdenii TaxID=131109 RepID=A0A3P1V8V2_9ACTO|nr:hypothetical protein [Actinomyces bowdenii]RRD30644.1 hypothetical protein EII10_00535 [Actinomyces bowdenii]